MAKSNKYIRKIDINKLFKIGIVVILLFAIFAVWYYFNFNKKRENFNIIPELYYFSSENCGHCKKFNETWDNIDTDIIKKKFVDGTAEFKEIEEKFNITHFPTILLVYGDKTIEYDGERTEDNIVKWLNDNIVVSEPFKNKK